MSHPQNGPAALTADQRLSEVAAILATGLLRLRFRTRVAGEEFLGKPPFCLEVGQPRRPHVPHARKKKGVTT